MSDRYVCWQMQAAGPLLAAALLVVKGGDVIGRAYEEDPSRAVWRTERKGGGRGDHRPDKTLLQQSR